MYKTDTHVHTADSSNCGKLKATDMVRMYHDAGFHTLFISDHLHKSFSEALGNIPWAEKMTIFLAGYYRAKAEGERLGMHILPAAEYTLKCSPNHYLAYGIDKAFLDAYPDILDMSLEEFSAVCKKHNVFLVQAHPYRDGKNTPTPAFVDAMEILNTNPRHENFDDRCKAIATEHGLPVTAGSDSHCTEDVAKGGVLSETEIKTTEDYIQLLKDGALVLYESEEML